MNVLQDTLGILLAAHPRGTPQFIIHSTLTEPVMVETYALVGKAVPAPVMPAGFAQKVLGPDESVRSCMMEFPDDAVPHLLEITVVGQPLDELAFSWSKQEDDTDMYMDRPCTNIEVENILQAESSITEPAVARTYVIGGGPDGPFLLMPGNDLRTIHTFVGRDPHDGHDEVGREVCHAVKQTGFSTTGAPHNASNPC